MSLWVKVCGPREPEEAVAVAALGVDAVGINLVGGSPRHLAPAAARRVCDALAAAHPEVERIGVTVNFGAGVGEYVELVEAVGLTAVQLHGDEPPELLKGLVAAGIPVVRALRVGAGDDRAATEAAVAAAIAGGARVLLDARVQGAYGGTGERLDAALVRWLLARQPLIVAGGLTPENVGEVVSDGLQAAGAGGRLRGVDVASGVENDQGRKDLGAVRRFLGAVRSAERQHSQRQGG